MRKFLVLILLGIIITILHSGCEKLGEKNDPDDYEYVMYGTSFGECLGYCVKSAKTSREKIVYREYGWDMNGYLPTLILQEEIWAEFWTKLIEKIEFESFLELDTVIGCPDCLDGGAEWIEIKKNGSIHKVTFEYWNEPGVVENYIGYLRTYMNAFADLPADSVDFNHRTLIDQQGEIRQFECSNGCYQYLIELQGTSGSVLYFDQNLEYDFRTEGLQIRFNGVLQYDSTMIFKPGPIDIPVMDFKARNINTFNMAVL